MLKFDTIISICGSSCVWDGYLNIKILMHEPQTLKLQSPNSNHTLIPQIGMPNTSIPYSHMRNTHKLRVTKPEPCTSTNEWFTRGQITIQRLLLTSTKGSTLVYFKQEHYFNYLNANLAPAFTL